MANAQHLAQLRRGPRIWNSWRDQNPASVPDLSGADLSGTLLVERLEITSRMRAEADMYGPPSYDQADLELSPTTVAEAANLSGADLRGAGLARADLVAVDLAGADLTCADLHGAHLAAADLSGAVVRGWSDARAGRTNLSGADLTRANLTKADFRDAGLEGVRLGWANLTRADFRGANMPSAQLGRASARQANFAHANLQWADLGGADFTRANLRGAFLSSAVLSQATFCKARLDGANLEYANMVQTDFRDASLSGCAVYGASTWDIVVSQATRQNDLQITPDTPQITTDGIEVAQFVHFLQKHGNIRDVIQAIVKRGVLLLGSFGRKRLAVLRELRTQLRQRRFLPIICDFAVPQGRDTTETIATLVGLSQFVIADITSPRSIPLELQATIPNFMVPFATIIQEGERPFSMFKDLWVKHAEWVLPPISYASVGELVQGLDAAIIEPAMQRAQALMVQKAMGLEVRPMAGLIAQQSHRAKDRPRPPRPRSTPG